MYNYEEDNNYLDEEKKSKIPFFIFLIVIVGVIFGVVVSCDFKEKDKNANLAYLRFTNATITPQFNKNKYTYTVETSSDVVRVICSKQSQKAKVSGCNKEISISDTEVKHLIKVTAENGDSKKYVLNISKIKEETKKINVSIDSNIKSGEKTTLEQIKLEAKLSEKVSVKYEWYKNGVKIQDATSSTLLVKESGTYNVKIINGIGDYSE